MANDRAEMANDRAEMANDPNDLHEAIHQMVAKYNPAALPKIPAHITKASQLAGGNELKGMQALLKKLQAKYTPGGSMQGPLNEDGQPPRSEMGVSGIGDSMQGHLNEDGQPPRSEIAAANAAIKELLGQGDRLRSEVKALKASLQSRDEEIVRLKWIMRQLRKSNLDAVATLEFTVRSLRGEQPLDSPFRSPPPSQGLTSPAPSRRAASPVGGKAAVVLNFEPAEITTIEEHVNEDKIDNDNDKNDGDGGEGGDKDDPDGHNNDDKNDSDVALPHDDHDHVAQTKGDEVVGAEVDSGEVNTTNICRINNKTSSKEEHGLQERAAHDDDEPQLPTQKAGETSHAILTAGPAPRITKPVDIWARLGVA